MAISLKHLFNSAVSDGSTTWTGTLTSGSNQITSVSPTPTGVIVGNRLYNANIPSGTTVSSVSGSTITMSANATGSASGATFYTDDKLVQASDWNAEHALTLATNRLLGRTSAGTGAAEEISVGSSLVLSGGSLSWSNTQPLLIGGTSASSSLTLQSTSGVGTTDSILFKIGNNGATTAMTINSSGVSEVISGTSHNIASQYDVGTAPNQIPLNQYLGTMAYQDASAITSPLHVGGNTPTSSLTIQSTTASGTSDSILFKVGNNGATTAMTINTSGRVGVGTTSPAVPLQVGIGGIVNSAYANGRTADNPSIVVGADSALNGIRINSKNYGLASASFLDLFNPESKNGDVTSGYRLLGGVTSGAATSDAYLSFSTIALASGGTITATERMRITNAGNLGIGTTAPTARLMLAAGAAAANSGPMKFTSGTNLTTPEAGAVEYDGTIMTATSNTNFKRGTIPLTNYTSGTGTALGTNTEATNATLLPAANDTITLSIGTYFVDMCFIVTRGATSTTSATARLNICGTGTAAGNFSGISVSAPVSGALSSNFVFDAVNITADNVLTAASTTAAGVYTIHLRGVLKITTSGTIIPQYSLSANINAAGTVSKVLYFTLQQLDTQSAAAFGPAGAGWA